MKVKTQILRGITTLSISLLATQMGYAQSASTTEVTTTPGGTTTQTTTIVTPAPATVAGSTDNRDLRNPDFYPERRKKQMEDYNARNYRFAPKPRSMWEVGVAGGLHDILGDVPTQPLGKNGSYGISVDVRKSWSYLFSTRLQYTYAVSKGMGYILVDPNVNRSFTGYDGLIVPNYRMQSQQLNLDLMINIGNISFNREHNGVSFYGFVGMGALAFQTKVNQLDANGQQYNFGGIVGSTPQTAANKATIQNKLYKAMDNTYETNAETQPDKTKLGKNTLDFTPSIGIGAQVRLNSRINLQIEDRLSAPAGEDMLDGVRFANSSTPQLTVSNDVINYASIGINFNVGSKRRHTEPLYWINPMNLDRPTVISTTSVVAPNNDATSFSMRAPRMIPLNNNIKETFPIRNSVFFDAGSTEIPNRYVLLNKEQAASFSEQQLLENKADGGHPYSQLSMYYNVLNIVGDRMRSNPNSTIVLKHLSGNGAEEGRAMAEHVKQYLVDNFGIDGSRITIDGEARVMEPTGTRPQDVARLRADNRRVDIESNSPALLTEVDAGETPYMRPVQTMARQQDPLDSFVLFNVDGELPQLTSWSVKVTDDQGNVQNFGPYMQEQVAIPVNNILGGKTQGNYEMVMLGQTKDGRVIKKESSLNLVTFANPEQQGARYSILFDFDKAKTVETYHKFLTEVVAPSISENATVFIHGHTDNIGTKSYNEQLSQERAMSVQHTLENALAKEGTKGVTFETYGFGEEENTAPFANNLPEEHFYNRTVVIDIVTKK